jgi:hypothetical protein
VSAAIRLNGEISQLFANSTQVDAFEELLARQSDYKVNGLDLKGLTDDFARQVAELLQRRSEALWRAKMALEETARNFSSWMGMSDDSDRNISVISTAFSRQPVNLSLSSVKVPIDVAKTDKSLVSSIRLSKLIEDTWVGNLGNDSSMSWQYFGSSDGFLRVYPAVKWRQDFPDTFDARFERWYLETSIVPADIVILIDRSGSMHGLPIKIATQTTMGIVNLVTERDRLAIITFSSNIKLLGCLDSSLQRATRDAKSVFIHSLSSIECMSVSSFKPAFTHATELLLPENSTDFSRQKIIVLLTDGSPIRNQEFFRQWNADKRIRVFSNVVGPPVHDTGSSRKIACENAGYHRRVRSLEAVRDSLRQFVILMGRTAAFLNSKTVITPPMKSKIDGQLVSRLSLLAVNGIDGIRNNSFPAPTALGVLGVDIPLSELEGLIPRHLITPLGYGIIIDNYGRCIFHPKLNEVLHNSLATDILLLEGESFVDIQAAMLRGETGSMTRNHSVVIEHQGGLFVREMEMTFSYAPVWPNSSVSVCLVVPRRLNETISVKTPPSSWEIPSSTSLSVRPWLQCVNSRDFNGSDIDSVRRLDVINGTACQEWRDRVLIDLQMTAHLTNTWTDRLGTCHLFSSTLAGVTRRMVFNHSCINESGNHVTDTLSRVARAVLYGNSDLIIDHRIGNTAQITKTVYDKSPIAVIGLDIHGDILQRIFNESLYNLLNATNRLYIIDESGYIVEYLEASGAKDETRRGQLLGQYEGSLINVTVDRGVFTETTLFSYSTQCHFQQSMTSSATSYFLQPWALLHHYILVWLYDLVIFLLNADLVSLTMGDVVVLDVKSDPTESIQAACLLKQTVYTLSNDEKSHEHAPLCCQINLEEILECTATYSITPIPDTNLLIVVIDGDIRYPHCTNHQTSQSQWLELPSPCNAGLSNVTSHSQPINMTQQLGRYSCTSRGERPDRHTGIILICILVTLGIHKIAR